VTWARGRVRCPFPTLRAARRTLCLLAVRTPKGDGPGLWAGDIHGASTTAGRKGQTRRTRPQAPRLIGEKSHCTTTKSKAKSRKRCTYTFIYAAKTAKNLRAIATAKINGHRRVIAGGRIRHHKQTLVFRHLPRGRYKLTLLKLGAHGKRTMIGRTTIAVS
jgi:hypothetical protein